MSKTKNINNFSVKVKIVNNSKTDISKSEQEVFQMENWNFPETIKKGETIETTVGFLTGEGINLSEDFGKVKYKTPEDDGHLSIRAFWPCFKSEGTGTLISFPEGFIQFSEGKVVTLTISSKG
jgi:hypothetical protein